MKNEKREKIEYRQAPAICGNTPPNLNSTLSSMTRIGGGRSYGITWRCRHHCPAVVVVRRSGFGIGSMAGTGRRNRRGDLTMRRIH